METGAPTVTERATARPSSRRVERLWASIWISSDDQCARLGQRTILESRPAFRHDEMIQRHVQESTARRSSFEKIRDVESIGAPHEAHRRALDACLANPQMSPEERPGTEAQLDAIDADEG
jgi:hypothetical protein